MKTKLYFCLVREKKNNFFSDYSIDFALFLRTKQLKGGQVLVLATLETNPLNT